MKKIISLILLFVFVLSSFAAFAHDDVLYGTLEETKLAETYVSRPVRFFSARKTRPVTHRAGLIFLLRTETHATFQGECFAV